MAPGGRGDVVGSFDDVRTVFLALNVQWKRSNRRFAKQRASRAPFAFNTDGTYDWENRQWSVPLNAGVLQVLRLGGQLVQVGVLGRYWAESPQLGPHGWALRLNVTFLFPR